MPAITAGSHRAICSEIVAPSNLFMMLIHYGRENPGISSSLFEQHFPAHVRTWTTAGKEDLLHFDPKGFMPIVKTHNKSSDHISKFVAAKQGFDTKG